MQVNDLITGPWTQLPGAPGMGFGGHTLCEGHLWVPGHLPPQEIVVFPWPAAPFSLSESQSIGAFWKYSLCFRSLFPEMQFPTFQIKFC